MSNYGLVVGVNHYTPEDKRGLRPLHGAIKDASDFHQWLITKGNVPSANCHLIPNTADPLVPIKRMIDNAITAINDAVLANDNNDADRLYFYFAGHGLGVELDDANTGMCMADWDEPNRDTSALSSSDYLRKFQHEGLFKEIVMFLDCCRDPKLYFKPQGPGSIIPMGPNRNPKWIVGYATQAKEKAFEASTGASEVRGVFTRILLEGLNGAASKDGGKSISAQDLMNHLYFNVPGAAQLAGFTQKPMFPNYIDPTVPFYFV